MPIWRANDDINEGDQSQHTSCTPCGVRVGYLLGSPHSSVDTGPPDHFLSAYPMTSHPLVSGSAVNGERSESAGREAPLTADPETKIIERREAEAGPRPAARGADVGYTPAYPARSAPSVVGCWVSELMRAENQIL